MPHCLERALTLVQLHGSDRRWVGKPPPLAALAELLLDDAWNDDLAWRVVLPSGWTQVGVAGLYLEPRGVRTMCVATVHEGLGVEVDVLRELVDRHSVMPVGWDDVPLLATVVGAASVQLVGSPAAARRLLRAAPLVSAPWALAALHAVPDPPSDEPRLGGPLAIA